MGTTTKQAVAVEGELRCIAVLRIRVVDGFSIRVASAIPSGLPSLWPPVRAEGVLEPVVVTPNRTAATTWSRLAHYRSRPVAPSSRRTHSRPR